MSDFQSPEIFIVSSMWINQISNIQTSFAVDMQKIFTIFMLSSALSLRMKEMLDCVVVNNRWLLSM
jgi:hypothetical protein